MDKKLRMFIGTLAELLAAYPDNKSIYRHLHIWAIWHQQSILYMLTQLKTSQQCRQNQFYGSSNMGHSRWDKEAKKIQWRLQRTEQMGCGGREWGLWSKTGGSNSEVNKGPWYSGCKVIEKAKKALVGLWFRVVTALLLSFCSSESLPLFTGNLPLSHFPEAQDFHLPPFACHPWTCLQLLPFPW